MTLWYELLEDGTIGRSTNSEKVAQKDGLTLTTQENIVYGDDGKRYLESECPEPPPPTQEEQSEKRAEAYRQEVDPITCHIQRLSDEEQTPEIEHEIADLKQERSEKVEEIKERYPYPENS